MNIIEDDRPLQGPWSRRRAEVPPERNFPEQEAQTGYGGRTENDDAPLQGPWSRRREETTPEPVDLSGGGVDADSRSQGDYDVEPQPVRGKGREVPTLRREEPDNDPVVHGHSFKIKNRETEETSTDSPVSQRPREAVCPDLNNPRALLNHLFSASGIYAGVIMAEVLGSRGGKYGRQFRRY